MPDDIDNRIVWYFETPAYDFERLFDLKQLDGAEIFLDKLLGKVDIKVEYRPDADPCWHFWDEKAFCVSQATAATVANPVSYPVPGVTCTGYSFPWVLPTPPAPDGEVFTTRPAHTGYQFQMRFTIKGQARFRGLLFFAIPVERPPGEGLK